MEVQIVKAFFQISSFFVETTILPEFRITKRQPPQKDRRFVLLLGKHAIPGFPPRGAAAHRPLCFCIVQLRFGGDLAENMDGIRVAGHGF